MSEPSDWPLSADAIRVLVPLTTVDALKVHPLARAIYPLSLGYYPKAHRHSMRRLQHDDYLLMYCIDGVGHLRVGEKHAEIHAGDMVMLSPGQTHAYYADGDKPWSLFWFHFKGEQATEIEAMLGLDTNMPVLRQLSVLSLQAHFYALMDLLATGYSLNNFALIASHVQLILTHTVALLERNTHSVALDSVKRATSFMRENLHRNVSLDEFSEHGNMSKFHFNRRYKAITGYSPIQHFTHLKVEQACIMLEQPVLSVSQIAFKLGYDDPLYFSRVFKKKTGLSPTAYRKRLK